MQITAAAQTNIGLVRHNNEDRLLCVPELGLFAVADGIGGLPGGEKAAQLAVDTLRERFFLKPDLEEAFYAANEAVVALGEDYAPETGLGTTLCAAHLDDGWLHVANVGDSRAYLYREGKLVQLTHDDTVENEVRRRRRRGELIELEDRQRYALTRCIGQPMPLHVHVDHYSLQVGDRVLVCTDGICRELSEAAISALLAANRELAVVMESLIEAALAHGGSDNATGVLVRVDAL